MAEHLANIMYVISIIFIIYYVSTYIYYKFIKKDTRLLGVGIIDYILNTSKIMKGDK